MAALPDHDHGALMDTVYRGQRHIYDASRKYFLFGRDRLIADLNCPQGGSILEMACGTGRNLHRIRAAWPATQLHGLDISSEMLKTARARLGSEVQLTLADATRFDPHTHFGRETFDRVILSYCLSMIPDWESALDQAAATLAPGGSLHVVDFGDMSGLPTPVRMGLKAWLGKFHVSPRHDLPQVAARLATRRKLRLATRQGMGGYYNLIRLENRGRMPRAA